MNPYGKTFVLGLVAVSLSFADPSVIAGERPNVLYILADDIGWGDVGAYHEAQTGTAPVVPTPNLDALARDGMMFTDAHTPAALCAPTRFSLLTGSNPVRVDVDVGEAGQALDIDRVVSLFLPLIKSDVLEHEHPAGRQCLRLGLGVEATGVTGQFNRFAQQFTEPLGYRGQ